MTTRHANTPAFLGVWPFPGAACTTDKPRFLISAAASSLYIRLIRCFAALVHLRFRTARQQGAAGTQRRPFPRVGAEKAEQKAAVVQTCRTLTGSEGSVAPRRIGRYDVIKKLGHGGMGDVWLAHDPSIERAVAIKVIAVREGNAIPGQGARFRAEMKALGKLTHKNIVRILDAEIAGGQAHIVMEKLEGSDLKTRLERGEAFPLSRAIDVIRQVLSALEHAHEHFIVHGDIKPANVMLDKKGVATVLDFGAARFVEPDATIMRWPDALTPAYASPEQAVGADLDFRTDLYSAGVMLHELATGHRPKANASNAEILRLLTSAVAASGQHVSAKVLAAMAKVLRRALRSNPKRRHESASAFIAAMVASGQEPTPSSPCIAQFPRAHRAWVAWAPRLVALPFFLGGAASQLVLPPLPESRFVVHAAVQPEPMLPETTTLARPPASRPEPARELQFAPAGALQPVPAVPAALIINQPGTVSNRAGFEVATNATAGPAQGRQRTTLSTRPASPAVWNDARRSSVDLDAPTAQEALDTTAAASTALDPVEPPATPSVSEVCRGMGWIQHVKCIVATCSVRANWNDPECNRKPQEP